VSVIAFAVCGAVLALAGASPARAQIIYDGTIVDRAGTYNGNPAHLPWNGWHYLDSGGWAYLFFITGSALNVNKNDHAVAEARFHP
jgi:hypothetical protein